MKTVNYITKAPKMLTLFVLLFLLSFIVAFYVQKQYMKKSEQNYVSAIHNEVKLLIETKKKSTFAIAQRLAIDKKLVSILKHKQYDKLYDKNVFTSVNKFKKFKNLWLHIVDANGVNRYLSWVDQKNPIVGKYILNSRKDLVKVYRDHQPLSIISVGMFDITFKGIMPIYDDADHFLGIVEVVSHLNSIAKGLEKDQIYSALVIEKRFTKQLTKPYSKIFIDGYNISTLHLNRDVKGFLQKRGVEYFLKDKYSELNIGFFGEYFFVSKVDILGADNKIIAHYIIFIKDKNNLEIKEFILIALTLLMGILFLLMSYFGFKTHIGKLELIESLDTKVKVETKKNLSLIYHDQLTGCYTKVRFLKDKALNRSREIVMLNMKNFSQINATYGFTIGDEVLRLTVFRLQTILERKIYRIDSDEFIFTSDGVTDDINHINHHFNDDPLHVTKDDINIRVSFSFSVVHGSEEDTLRKLTIALKQAKKEPFKEFVYYKEQNVNNDFLKFNSYLYDAIFAQQDARIVPYFQGIRNNKSNKIIKYESLARLEVNGKIYSPYYFIEVAKSSGFLVEITKIMIDKSFAYLSKYSKDITISINITEDDLYSKNLKEYLLEKLEHYNINANQIVLEILEGVSAGGTHSNVIQLKELKELGFQLAIDDFGVEYSNFERISDLDVDFIKIDGKYIKNLDTDPKSYKIVKAISEFATSMNIPIIAEFVENETIQKIVAEIGIEFSQGYHFSIPAEKFISETI